MKHQDRLEALQQTVDQVNRGLEQVRASLQDLEQKLGKVSQGQESFELQLALLSKEAEQYDSRLSLIDGDDRAPSVEQFDALREDVAELSEQVARLLSDKSTVTGQRLLSGQLTELQTWLATDGRAIGNILDRVEALELQASGAGRSANLRYAGSGQKAPERPDGSRKAFVTDAALAAQRQTLADEVSALKAAGGVVYDRLVRLEQHRRFLKHSLAALGVEHARRDHETETLKKQLRRSALLTLATLLVVTTLGVVWINQAILAEPRGPGIPNDMTEVSRAKIDVSELAKDIELLRNDMGFLEQSLAAVGRKVDSIIMSPAPALAREVERLSATVVRLVDGDVRRQQGTAAARIEQTPRQQAEPHIDNDAIPLIDNQTSAPQQSLTRQLTPAPPHPAASSEVPRASASEQAAEPLPSTALSVVARGNERWAQARTERRYTVQLMGVRERRHIEAFMNNTPLAVDHVVHIGERAGRPWLTLLHGIYASLTEAQAAAAQLPEKLLKQKPWARRIPVTGRFESQ